MKKSNKIERAAGTGGLITNAAKGALLGMALTLIAIFVFALLMRTGTLPNTLSDALILAGVVLGSAAGGLYCAGKQGGGVVVAGLTAAAAYTVLALLGTLVFQKNGNETALTLRVIIASVAGGCFGGVLKLHRKNKKSRLRR